LKVAEKWIQPLSKDRRDTIAEDVYKDMPEMNPVRQVLDESHFQAKFDPEFNNEVTSAKWFSHKLKKHGLSVLFACLPNGF